MTSSTRAALRLACLTLSRWFERVSRFWLYLGAGLLRTEELQREVAGGWRDFLSAEAEIAAGWWRWEERIVESLHLEDNSRILVIGCGTGRDVLPFLERGHRCTGIDPAPGVLAHAERAILARGWTAELIPTFFEDWNHTERQRSYEVLWFSWYSYSYIPERRRRIEALRKATSLMAPGGRTVVSVVTSPPQNRMWKLGRAVSRISLNNWAPAPGDVLRLQPGDRSFSFEHAFEPGEAEAEFAEAGLAVVSRQEMPSTFVLARQGHT